MNDDAFRDLSLFADFPEKERRLLEHLFVEDVCRKGTVLIREGERAASMKSALFVLLDGQVQISRARPDVEPDASVFAFSAIIEPPELFGIVALATDMPSTATCTAFTDCRLARLNRPAFVQLHHEHGTLAARFELLLARQLVRDLRRLTTSLLSTFEHVQDDPPRLDPLALSIGRS